MDEHSVSVKHRSRDRSESGSESSHRATRPPADSDHELSRKDRRHKHQHRHHRSSDSGGEDRRTESDKKSERERHRDREKCEPRLKSIEDRSRLHHCSSKPESDIASHRDQIKQKGGVADCPSASSPCDAADHHENDEKPKLDKQQSLSGSCDDIKRPSYSHLINFDWMAHKSTFDNVFFRDDGYFKKGSKEYDEFWLFLQKYLSFQKKNPAKQPSHTPTIAELQQKEMELPRDYEKQYRLNVNFLQKDLPSLLRNAQRQNYERHRIAENLTNDHLLAFHDIIIRYIDFLQKQKIAKMAKIKHDQQNLPIYEHRQEIIDTLATHQVVVVAGDTGCGKSTQVPQYLLAAGYTKVACTQPRRIACISLSRRVAFETFNEYGSEVGYQVRFERSRTSATRILFLTEGLLLRQIESDPALSQYSVLVIDEVHERHIHTDFLLGVVKCILTQRQDLKLVLMSATINIDLFSNYFDNAPVCKVPGRLYPIQLIYQPIEARDKMVGGKTQRLDPGPYVRILQAIDHKYQAAERGDVLIFLSGMSDIMSVVEAARDYSQRSKSWIILPLHSALSVAEQDKVFDFPPEGVRKCIVSTNIAETSVTIDGVRFVVDSGKVKEMSYDSTYKMQRLQEFWISRASAEQRKGRAGRTGPGVCYRLYAESDYEELQEYSTPEIHRVPLDSLILQMISMGLPNARKFPFIEPPPAATIETSISYLKEQGALQDDEQLTTIGEMLAQLPVDVVIGKMLIMASVFEMVEVVLSVAAALCVQSVFTSRAQRDYDASTLRKSLESEHGDPLTLLNAYSEWVSTKTEGADSRKWCRRRGLEEQRFYEMTKLKQQFHDLLAEHGLLPRPAGDDDDDDGTVESGLTPVERRQRHANRRRLAELRREQKKHVKKRKILKLEDDEYTFASDGDEEDDTREDTTADIDSSIRDLEFRLSNEMNQLQEQVSTNQETTRKDATLLKVILCSGLFPQVAIADEYNSFKNDSEQVFHTRAKGFILLHPTSVFATNPEPLQLKESQIKDQMGVSGSVNRGQLSSGHQLLAFVSLVETTKPYLVNVLRIPAMQTLLLFSNSIDTNSTCSRMVCDSWLEIMFENPADGEAMLSAAVKLRAAWQQLLQLKLAGSGRRRGIEEGARKRRRQAEHMQKLLRTKLSEFLRHSVYYYIRRVLSAEHTRLYRGPCEPQELGPNSLGSIAFSGSRTHPIKGGIVVDGGYLVYDCLQDDASSSVYGEYTVCMQRHWTCPRCERSLIVTIGERLAHEQECERQQLEASAEESMRNAEEQAQQHGLNALRKPFHCTVCGQNLSFTTAELMRHKKSCTAETSSQS